MAQQTGMARHIDHLGRIVIPVELRRHFDIQAGDAIDVSTESDAIVLRKQESACVFCRSTEELGTYKDRAVCRACRADLVRAGDQPPPP
ncbi:MAG: AbrB/MazE/SpoVT family DNA-binding domain-containing protein [Acidimicrobiales bacterium]